MKFYYIIHFLSIIRCAPDSRLGGAFFLWGVKTMNKTVAVQIRMTPIDKAAIQAVARFEQRKTSEMLRELVRQAAQERGLWPPKATAHEGQEVTT